MGRTAQSNTPGDYCECPENAKATTVREALTGKMSAVHSYNPKPRDPRFDQGWHGYIAAAAPHLMKPFPGIPENLPFTAKGLGSVLGELRGRESKSPGEDGVRYWMRMLTKGGSPFQAPLRWLFNTI